jgi:hypothetical protein
MSAKILKFNNTRKINLHRLPFVANRRDDNITPFWSIPATGGYCGGHQTGEAMALAYLKFLRSPEADKTGGLSFIVGSMMARYEMEGGQKMEEMTPSNQQSESYSSFLGQYVGFFNELNTWLTLAAKYFGAELDNISESEILVRANNGLNLDEMQYVENLLKEYRAQKPNSART